jgi:dihydrofolate reductase
MGMIALSQNTSLDGVMQLDGLMQSPGPTDVPFKYTGWDVDFDGGPEGDRFNYGEEFGLEQAQNAEALLLGRVTYEIMQAYWPTAEGELADRLNELPKYVVSSTLTDPAWNATVLGDDWPEEVARLRKELDGEILVQGQLARVPIGPMRSAACGGHYVEPIPRRTSDAERDLLDERLARRIYRGSGR